MISCAQAAAILGVSTIRVAQLCRQGRIAGAAKLGKKAWMIPDNFTVSVGLRGPVGAAGVRQAPQVAQTAIDRPSGPI